MLFVIALGQGAIVGYLAKRAGRQPVGWAVAGFLVFLPALIVLAVLESRDKKKALAGPPLPPPPAEDAVARTVAARQQDSWSG
ncbi:MAG: hypothetical protein OEW66_03245 [Actinomycetota bacterium]|nr:hypothetical protein [Actinomycetota bacterium]